MRRIEIYAMIEPSGIKRAFIDLVNGGRVSDREVSEGHTHASVDAEAVSMGEAMAKSYGTPAPVNLGTVDRYNFYRLAQR